jgi:polysaccharide biosynthesis transport protein
LLLAITLTVALAGILYALILPPIYRAESRLLIENAQIPDELAASTVRSTADEILLSIQQRILTRENLMALADRHDLFAGATLLRACPRSLRRWATHRHLHADDAGQYRGRACVVRGGDPELSAERHQRHCRRRSCSGTPNCGPQASGSTLDFFEQEVRRLTDELAQQNAKILEFEQANRDALPESLEYRRTRQASQQERLLQVDRELASLRDRRDRLTELYDRTGRLVTSDIDRTPEQERLEQARQELASALVVLSPNNPRLKALQTEVAALEER